MADQPEPPLPSLEQFEKKLAKAQKTSPAAHPPHAGMALRLGAEFAAGTLVGTGAGILLDRWWGTSPLMLILCLCLGVAAGVKTMLQTVKRYEANIGE